MAKIPIKTIERLIIFRRVLNMLKYNGESSVFSKNLAELAGSTPEQVRSDLMMVGSTGTPAHGYDVIELEKSIAFFLDDPHGQKIAVIGMGKFGRSLFDYCYWSFPNLALMAGFDVDPKLVNKKYNGFDCYHIDRLHEIITKERINVALMSVPPDMAQITADALVKAGIKSIVNYTQIPLKVPRNVHVENVDLMATIEKVAYISRQLANK